METILKSTAYTVRPIKPALGILINKPLAKPLSNTHAVLSEQHYANLYKQHFEELHLYAKRFLQDGVRAQDAVQEAFLRLWSRRALTSSDANIRALLYKSVRNLCLNAIRDDKTHERLMVHMPEPAQPADPASAAHGVLMQAQIEAWVNDMPARRREVFELSRYANLSYKEIAEIMDISIKTVENHLVAALRFLRDRLQSFDAKLLQI